MSKKNEPVDTLIKDHEYDGIQEFNNPAPFWWQLSFYLSIAFAVVYFGYYVMGPGRTLDQELTSGLEEVQALQKKNNGPDVTADQLLALVKDGPSVARGKAVFESKCASCHAADGGGLIGPNLTDDYWIHDKGEILAIYRVIKDGVLDKGMPPWGAVISAEELSSVTGFVKSIHGQKVAKAKDPQGEKVTQ